MGSPCLNRFGSKMKAANVAFLAAKILDTKLASKLVNARTEWHHLQGIAFQSHID